MQEEERPAHELIKVGSVIMIQEWRGARKERVLVTHLERRINGTVLRLKAVAVDDRWVPRHPGGRSERWYVPHKFEVLS